MTHDDARSLLPGYALGALDQDVDALENHLRQCPQCRTELSAFLETTASLASAAPVVEPPRGLREAVLAETPTSTSRARRFFDWLARSAWAPRSAATAFAVLLLVVGMAAGTVIQRQQTEESRSQLALDERGLALLTSTETTVVRLDPTTPSQSHGHWYHRSGIATQVLVVEFMPALPPGDAYFGWLARSDGSWVAAGRLDVDSNGYARLILLGSDGSDVTRIVVTRQSVETSQPFGETVLTWAAS